MFLYDWIKIFISIQNPLFVIHILKNINFKFVSKTDKFKFIAANKLIYHNFKNNVDKNKLFNIQIYLKKIKNLTLLLFTVKKFTYNSIKKN